jgi:hypothetical protein
MSHTPRTPFSCSHTMVAGASIVMPGTTSVPPSQARTSLTGPKSQWAVAILCHPSSKTRIPRPSCICRNCHSKLFAGTSQPPRPLATIFMW